jgi:NAD(P)-dependent dehydrogenase (short-subunit alcohol dehydrogenase family)
MPAAAFLLMAIEAAQQLLIIEESDAEYIEISNFVFERPLPLSRFGRTPSLELHFGCWPVEDTKGYRFEILSLLASEKDSTERLCSGKFRWIGSSAEKIADTLSIALPEHDPWLLEQFHAIGLDGASKLTDLTVSNKGASGTFEDVTDLFDHYFVDPEVLDSILRVVQVPNMSREPPSMKRISSISSLTFSVPPAEKQRRGSFNVDMQPLHANTSEPGVQISLAENQFLSIRGIRFAVRGEPTEQPPASKSLFFKPIILPDITKMQPFEGFMELSEFLRLVTHKWPNSDIAISGLSGERTAAILESLRSSAYGGRPRYRSVTMVECGVIHSKLPKARHADRLSEQQSYHLLFMGNQNLDIDQAAKMVMPNALLCASTPREELQAGMRGSFVKLCEVTGPDGADLGSLWRRHAASRSKAKALSPHQLVIFGEKEQLTVISPAFPGAESVILDQSSVESILQRQKSQGTKFDAIVLDCREASIITTWKGQQLVPMFQGFLSSCESLIWVSPCSSNHNPHHGVAGNLLRSMQAEQPAIKTSWLMLEDVEEAEMRETLTTTYDELRSKHRVNEVMQQVKESGTKILRYLPDDELCVDAGVAVPRKDITSSLMDKKYEVQFNRAGSPMVLAWRDHGRPKMPYLKVRVNILASVVDSSDLSALHPTATTTARPSSCRFFAGTVENAGQCDFWPSSHVVGWYEGSHCGQVEVPPSQLRPHDGSTLPTVAAATFANLCVAFCVIDGTCRARNGDILDIRVPEILEQTLTSLCKDVGIEIKKPSTDKAVTFLVSLDDGGLQVNDSTVRVKEYLLSSRAGDMIDRYWPDKCRVVSFGSVLDLGTVQDSHLGLELKDLYTTALDHSTKEKTFGVTVNRKSHKEFLLAGDGAYVVVGGLGGLGRFVCSWMVENGARKLFVISRNGLKSKEAKETHATINASSASMEVIQADACDRDAMQKALTQVRKTSYIIGVLNLAMVLEDSQFASMTGEQWDRAVGLKRDSSWILHEETQEEPLDVFILFSSIASVLGNRGQGNYNVGNTFLNALAEHRRSLGFTAVSVALGAMSEYDLLFGESYADESVAELGVLHDLGKEDLVDTLSRSGLSPLGKKELAKIMEAAVLESRDPGRSLILTGLEMFDRVDGRLKGSKDQTHLFWTELPEFGFLQDHKLSDDQDETSDAEVSLRDRVLRSSEEDGKALLQEAFIGFLSQLLGFDTAKFQPSSSLSTYGLDSLSAVSCQYWLHRSMYLQ